MKIKTLIVDDHEIVRYGLRSFFKEIKDYEIDVIGEADNGRTAVELAQQTSPDLVFMDISLPELNGVEAAKQILKVSPSTRIIAFSMHSDRGFIKNMLKAGVSGYVLKSRVFNDLKDAIVAVLRKEIYISPKVAHVIMEDYKDIIHTNSTQSPALSSRQVEVLQLLTEGKSNKEIASILEISVNGVESIRRRIMLKLGIDTIAGLTKYAIQNGITSVNT
jgi:DNA-binding NarL/FixJ family response regulator